MNVERADIEAELEAAFKGLGRVSGAGTGKMGCHVDLEIKAPLAISEAREMVERALTVAGLTSSARIRVCEVFAYPRPENGG